jgi:hypothetical protein
MVFALPSRNPSAGGTKAGFQPAKAATQSSRFPQRDSRCRRRDVGHVGGRRVSCEEDRPEGERLAAAARRQVRVAAVVAELMRASGQCEGRCRRGTRTAALRIAC